MSIANKLIMIEEGEVPRGESVYATEGTYSWVCPAGVTSVSVVCVGGGGGGARDASYSGGPGGAGGGLGYKNNISVTPGSSYTVVVGDGGYAGTSGYADGTDGGDSYFINSTTVKGGGGKGGQIAFTHGGSFPSTDGGDYVGDGGGNGGSNPSTASPKSGGGGAGGYSGDGGNGGAGNSGGAAGSGGGAGGGGCNNASLGGYAGGGGVGILGEGTSGGASGTTQGGRGGSDGEDAKNLVSAGFGTDGARFGGGGGGCGPSTYNFNGSGSSGVVRIVWPGDSRSFPSTDVDTP